MKFSICVPNYNYAKFIERTLRSALDQNYPEIEVLVSDNASTDDSVKVVESIGDRRLILRRNQCNVGFAGNLDRTVQMARGDRIILLPSDDLLRPGILETYRKLYDHLGPRGERAIVGATVDLVDPEDKIIGKTGPDRRLWLESDRAPELDALLGGVVYRARGDELLKRCLRVMTNPYNLQTAAYPRALYDAICGYGGGRVINPDKWYHWRLLGVAEEAYYIDRPLGACRWHPSNQTAQQAASGALKYLIDEYVSTFEIDGKILERLGMTRREVEERFIEYDIARHGLATLGSGNRAKARRIVDFGQATYPTLAQKNRKIWALKALLAAGPVGEAVSKIAYKAYLKNDPRGVAQK